MTTTKIFLSNVDPCVISTEIDCVRDASPLPFTPTLLEVDTDGRWYTESFVPGDRSAKTSRSNPEALFKHTVCNYLAEIIQSKSLQTLALSEHLSSIQIYINNQLAYAPFDDDLCSRIDDFIRRIINKLERLDDVQILLAFAHGDFSFVNFIYGSDGITVIDWESAKHRGMLHDLYNYFFTELYYGRIPSMRRSAFSDSIKLLSQQLSAGNTQHDDMLMGSDEIYRWLYYLERIQMLMDREICSIQRNVILRSIDTFDQFETSTL